MKKTLLASVLALLTAPLAAQTGAINGFCTLGGAHAVTSGLSSSNYQQGIIPKCTVTVYLTGTTTLATITGGPASNPFTANTDGSWLFYVATNQGYDVVMSGGVAPNTFPSPKALTDVFPSSQFIAPGVITLQTNGVNNLDQSYEDVVAGSGVTATNTSGGHVRIDATGSLLQQVVPPIAGQHVVIYPTAFTTACLSGNCRGTPVGGVSSGYLNSTGGVASAGQSITWTGFTLPSYVLAANVTAMYAVATSSFSGSGGSSQFVDLYCSATSVGPIGLTPTGTNANYATRQVSTFFSGDGTKVASASCYGDTFGQASDSSNFGILNVASIGLVVYYTGAAPPVDSRVQIVPPLQYNPSIDTLAVDTTTLGGITQLTGDVNTASGSGSQLATLPNVNSTPGTCGDATHVCQTTTNAKGLTTTQTPVAITGGGGGASAIPTVIWDDDATADQDAALNAWPALNSWVQSGAVNLIAVINDSSNSFAAPSSQILKSFYGLGNIPVGAWLGAVPSTNTTGNVSTWTSPLTTAFNPGDTRTNYLSCVSVYRNALAAAQPLSVTIVATGFQTCVAALMQSSADSISSLTGAQLIKAKVNKLTIMGGYEPSTGSAEFNLQQDAVSANYVLANWTSQNGYPPVYFVGVNISTILTGISSGYPTTYPPAFVGNLAGFYTRGSWDIQALYSVIYASDTTAFTISANGTNTASATTGVNTFSTATQSGHFYLSQTQPDSYYQTLINTAITQSGSTGLGNLYSTTFHASGIKAASGNNCLQVDTLGNFTNTGFGCQNITSVSQVPGAAPLASPALTGIPTAPTAAPLTANTQVATTAYVDAAVAGGGGSGNVSSVNATAPLIASPATGAVTVSCPTCVAVAPVFSKVRYASGARAFGTVYQNTDAKPRLVFAVDAGATSAPTVVTDAVSTPTTQVWSQQSYSGASNPIYFLVMPGNYYKVTGTTFGTWYEYPFNTGTWTASGDLVGSKSLSTNYQNTGSGFKIVEVVLSGTVSGNTISAFTDATTTPTALTYQFTTISTTASTFFLVPQGAYYRVQTSGAGAIAHWNEYSSDIPATMSSNLFTTGDRAAVSTSAVPALVWSFQNTTGKCKLVMTVSTSGSTGTMFLREDYSSPPFLVTAGAASVSAVRGMISPQLPWEFISENSDASLGAQTSWFEFTLGN